MQIQDAHRSYYSACQLMDYSLIYPPNIVVSYEEAAKSHFGAHRHAVIDHNRFHECLVKKDLESAMRFIDDSFRQWRSQDWMSPVIVQSSAVEMVYRSLNALHALNMDTAPLLDEEDNLFLHQLRTKSIEELHGWVKSVAERTIRMIVSLEESIHPLVRRVSAYVDDLYSENISLKTIAHTFNVNAAYLGQLFIKEKNETFSSYLNMKRIEKAKEMLCSTSLELQEIAESVGYVNQSYFNSIFKKATGIYPTKYRLDHKSTSL
ncbi:helix-turn-helix transcriptional regulator [Paenibacillus contaminans]|nr:helix-turn-helix domain-containing protein [Paenibacillus contaminans]